MRGTMPLVLLIPLVTGCSLFQPDRGANDALFQGSNEDAIGRYTKVISTRPNNLNAHVGRGIAYQRSGQTLKAMRDYDRAIEIDPDSVAARLHRAQLYLEKGSLNQARADADHLLNQQLDDHDRLLALSLSSRIFEAQEMNGRALADAESALAIGGRDLELRNEPHYRDLVYHAAQLSYEANDFETARARMREYASLTESAGKQLSPRDHYLMCLLAYLNGSFDEAQKHLPYLEQADRHELASTLGDENFFLEPGDSLAAAAGGSASTGAGAGEEENP